MHKVQQRPRHKANNTQAEAEAEAEASWHSKYMHAYQCVQIHDK